MKKILLSILIILCAFTMQAQQYTLTDDDVVVTDGVIMSCSYSFALTDIIIPETLDGQTVTEIWGDPGVSDSVFRNKGLTSVQFPETLLKIGRYTFSKNTLKEVIIPNSVTEIGSGAFMSNQLTSVTLPTSITVIEDQVFSSNKLTSFTIPEGVTEIKQFAFWVNSLTSVSLPSSVTKIGEKAFGGSSGLAFITLPTVDITGLINWIDEDGNTYANGAVVTNVASFFIAQFAQTLTDDDVVVVDGIITSCTLNDTTTSITIPEVLDEQTIIGLGENLFYYKGLTGVILPETLTSIGERAFYKCNLTSITLPSGLTSIGNSAFRYCNLTSITLPSGLTTIGEYVFYDNSLTEILLPESLTSISTYAFANNNLTEVNIPGSVTEIEDFAFKNNSDLAKVTINEGVTSIGEFAFSSATFTDLTIPNSVTSIGKYAFYSSKLESFTLPTPTKTGYTLINWVDSSAVEYEAGATVTDKAVSYTANFEINTYVISGTVTGADGVSLTLSGDVDETQTITTSGDTFSFSVEYNKSVVLTASKLGYIFDTEEYEYPNIYGDKTATNFVASINEELNTYVPDDNFEQALIDLGYDDVLNDYVLTDNINAITSLDVSSKSIADLTGIEDFVALTYLNCSSNSLISLEISINTALETLYCYYNDLTSLDVSNNLALTKLVCWANDLTSLDVSKNIALTSLSCSSNALTSIDVSANIALTYLNVTQTSLTNLDVSTNTALTRLECSLNELTSIDITANTALTDLRCSGNNLTNLDVSNHTALETLLCYNNNLKRLNVANGNNSNLSYFKTTDNPDLTCIQVDDAAWSTTNWIDIDDTASFNEDCSSTFFITQWETTAANETITVPINTDPIYIYNYSIDWGDGQIEYNQTASAVHEYVTAGDHIIKISGDFPAIYFNYTGDKEKIKDIQQWGYIPWETFNRAFMGCTNLNSTATDTPDLTNVTNMSYMFAYCIFNGDVSNWDVSNITDMSGLFNQTHGFNGDVSNWDVSKVTNMSGMFGHLSSFNGDVSNWNVSNVTNMSTMFYAVRSLNRDLSGWDVSKVTNMSNMFGYNNSLNGDVLTNWDVSNVTDMHWMFRDSSILNLDISNWNVSNVTNMEKMFFNASIFNRDISNWDVGNVTNMTDMFKSASSFSIDNYDKLLRAWSQQTVQNNVVFGVDNTTYCAGRAGRDVLISKGWIITDAGLSTDCNFWSGNIDSNWTTASNWSQNSVPVATNTVLVTNGTYQPIIASNTVVNAKSLTIDSSATLTIAAGGGLTIDGDLNSADSNALTANSGSSIIVKGAANNSIRYNRNLATSNWYLIAPPIKEETIEDFRANNNLTIGSTNKGVTNIALAPYNNALTVNRWAYLNTISTGNLENAKGYSVKLDAPGDLTFSGEINTESLTKTITTGTNSFNLVGNPFTAYLNLGDFFTDNIVPSVLSESTAWFWNENSGIYDVKTSFIDSDYEIAPAQGFFLSSGSASAIATFDITGLTHQNVDAFQKHTDTRPQIKLFLNEGKEERYTRVFYIDGTTTGFDNGYDGTIFGGVTSSLLVYTQLVTDNVGENLGVQVLPNSNYDSMVIPVGVKIASGKEVTFSSESLNIPDGIKLVLEDRETNTFTQLDVAGSMYSFSSKEALNGIGRFYLHSSNSTLSIASSDVLNNISVYKLNTETLKITGLPNGKSSIKLFNLLGYKVLSTSFKSNGTYNMALPKISAGVYIVQIESDTRKFTKKIILE